MLASCYSFTGKLQFLCNNLAIPSLWMIQLISDLEAGNCQPRPRSNK